MSKRKSIVSSFGDLTSKPIAAEQPSPEGGPEKALKDVSAKPRVGAGIIGATRRSLTELREERDQLLASVKDGDMVVTLDADLIDPSPFKDRLPDDNEDSFEDLKSTLQQEGQTVPITVRRDPEDLSRYQIVYGHRRTRALRELGRPVEAILREYSDRELLIAQGIENSNRQDLSWIEKALFAATMAGQGLKPREIKAALNADDAQISKFRTVLGTIDRDVIERIGRAPKVGRPRWLELESLYGAKGSADLTRETLSGDKVSALSSDDRFALVLDALKVPKQKAQAQNVVDRKIGDIGRAVFSARDVRFVIDKEYSAAFSSFLEAKLDAIFEDFKKEMKED